MKRFSIKAKFILLFSTVALVTLGLSATAFWGQEQTVSSYRRMIHEELGARDQARHIQRLLMEMRLYERAYFLDQSAESLKNHDRVSAEFRKTLAALELSGKKEILDSFENYQREFLLAVEAMNQVVDPKTGLQGQLRSHAHSIEEQIKNDGLPDIYNVHLLMMRRHEKDFLLRGDTKYVQRMEGVVDEAVTTMKNSNRPDGIKEQFISEITKYHDAFKMMAGKYVTMKQSDAAMLKEITGTTEPLIQKAVDTIEVVVEEEQVSVAAKVKEMGMLFAGATVLVFVVLAIALMVVWSLSGSLAQLVEQLRFLGERNGDGSKAIQNVSERVSSAVTEQASAIQETVSTLDEISAMVERSVQNAELSFQASIESESNAQAGGQGMDAVTSSVNRIQENSNTVLERVERGHEEMGQILQVIQQIAEKTKVINDIVFQTKLLSFNASVEAARAGEHGKGFAVVAEEVGNLANMSGRAAGEIEGMLGESLTQVESILEKTRSEVKDALDQGTIEVGHGVQAAKAGRELMEKVQVSVSRVKGAMDEIRRAAKEQAEGVRNISTAMEQLDQATHENADMAQQSSTQASELGDRARELGERLQELENLVFGQKKLTKKGQEKYSEVEEDEHQDLAA